MCAGSIRQLDAQMLRLARHRIADVPSSRSCRSHCATYGNGSQDFMNGGFRIHNPQIDRQARSLRRKPAFHLQKSGAEPDEVRQVSRIFPVRDGEPGISQDDRRQFEMGDAQRERLRWPDQVNGAPSSMSPIRHNEPDAHRYIARSHERVTDGVLQLLENGARAGDGADAHPGSDLTGVAAQRWSFSQGMSRSLTFSGCSCCVQ